MENSNLLFILGLKLPLIIDNIKINFNFLHSRYKLVIFDADHVEQPLAGDGAALVAVFVREVDDGLDAGLDDHLGALVTREQGDVDGASGDILRVFVEDRVHLRVTNIHVFVLQSDTTRNISRETVSRDSVTRSFVCPSRYFKSVINQER